MNLVELLGTVASVIVAVSLTMKNIRWLRWVNLIGSALFATYGFLISAWPVFGLNAFIVVINVVYLVQLSSTNDRFSLLEVPVAEATQGHTLLGRFLETYGTDIVKFQPNFSAALPADARVFFVLREVLPISLFVCRPDGRGNQEILLDYAVPAWRDYQNARFLFQDGLRSLVWPGTGTFWTQALVGTHRRYLARVGFKADATDSNRWSWTLGD